ncbi:MAG: peptidoglycan recognition protein family protein [Candidatus Scalindua sp.]|nr:peptidoglycan recognition protein family protein [Candidatus Scalindua sp.]
MIETKQQVAKIVKRWRENLSKPDWYLHLEKDIRDYFLKSPESEIEKRIRWAIYDFVESALENEQIGLGNEGINWDIERKPIRFVVIHHSGTNPDISISRLSGMGLLRLYAPIYLNKKDYPEAFGQSIYSNHWKDNHQVFYAYHWLIRQDGTVERLLEDHHIGWHAGNWAVNCASIGICLAGNYSTKRPTFSMLESIKKILNSYSRVKVIPHCAIKKQTKCPGSWFNHTKLR